MSDVKKRVPEPEPPGMNELPLRFHAGKSYLMWIYFDKAHGGHP